jgi:hypothetical protein
VFESRRDGMFIDARWPHARNSVEVEITVVNTRFGQDISPLRGLAERPDGGPISISPLRGSRGFALLRIAEEPLAC